MKIQNTLLALASATLLAASPAFATGGAEAHHHEKSTASIGEPGQASQAMRTVQVEMRDSMQFVPSTLSVRQGETLRIVVKNTGQLRHEIVLGSEKDLKAHAEIMKKSPAMAHPEPQMLTLAGGQSGALLWKFSQAGVVDFACLQPGHFEAGMKGRVQVIAAKAAQAGDAHAH